jgi:hypothetical protein
LSYTGIVFHHNKTTNQVEVKLDLFEETYEFCTDELTLHETEEDQFYVICSFIFKIFLKNVYPFSGGDT